MSRIMEEIVWHDLLYQSEHIFAAGRMELHWMHDDTEISVALFLDGVRIFPVDDFPEAETLPVLDTCEEMIESMVADTETRAYWQEAFTHMRRIAGIAQESL